MPRCQNRRYRSELIEQAETNLYGLSVFCVIESSQYIRISQINKSIRNVLFGPGTIRPVIVSQLGKTGAINKFKFGKSHIPADKSIVYVRPYIIHKFQLCCTITSPIATLYFFDLSLMIPYFLICNKSFPLFVCLYSSLYFV